MKPCERFKQMGIRLGKLAEDLRITPGAISQWDKVPAGRVVEVARLTGIPREELRPDLYLEAAE